MRGERAETAAGSRLSACGSVAGELHVNGFRDDAGLNAALEEEAHGFAAFRSVVECPVVDVHADECVGFGPIQSACEFHGVVERSASMLQSIRDAVVKMARNTLDERLAKVGPDDVAAQRKRQTCLLE